jgi:hypothetical protein
VVGVAARHDHCRGRRGARRELPSPVLLGRAAGHLENGFIVDNDEEREPIAVCTGLRERWSALWPELRHYD